MNNEYTSTNKPAILLEYPVHGLPEEYNFRLKRFAAAFRVDQPIDYLPYTMVDSGYMIHTDYGSLSGNTAAYRTMIESEWNRPPQAQVTAYWDRVGSHFNFLVDVTNQSGVDLVSPKYLAEVTALVYEEVTPDPNSTDPLDPAQKVIYHTNRYVRSLTHVPITTPLKVGETRRFAISTKDIAPLDWDKLHGLAFVDYRPGGGVGKYDMLQAAPAVMPAVPVELSVGCQNIIFLEDRSKLSNPTQTFKVSGYPSPMVWTVSSSKPWLKVSPASGRLTDQITISLDIKGMATGTYEAQIEVSAMMPDPKLQQVIPVHLVIMDSLNYFWLPIVGGPLPTPTPTPEPTLTP